MALKYGKMIRRRRIIFFSYQRHAVQSWGYCDIMLSRLQSHNKEYFT